MPITIQRTVIGILLVYTLFASPFLGDLSRAFFQHQDLSYTQRVTKEGYNGLPMPQISTKAQALLKDEMRVALGPNIMKSDFLHQRFTEGLYPVIVDSYATAKLDFVSATSIAQVNCTPLLKGPSGEALCLMLGNGQIQRENSNVSIDDNRHAFSLIQLLLCLIGAFGIGTAMLRGIPSTTVNSLNFLERTALRFIAGLVLITIIVSCATYLGVGALPLWCLATIGIAAFGIFGKLWLGNQERMQQALSQIKGVRLEQGVALGLGMLFFLMVCFAPVALWDGRSIWLFNAHKIFHSGMISRADFTHEPFYWSHPVYPLFATTTLAYFSGFATLFNERMAMTGFALLFTSILILCASRLSKLFNRVSAIGILLWLFMTATHLVMGAYVDSILALLLLTAVLYWIGEDERRPVAYLLFCAASLIKFEGALLTILALTVLVLNNKLPNRKRSFIAASLTMLPAFAHGLFLSFIKVKSKYAEALDTSLLERISDRVDSFSEFLLAAPSQQDYLQLYYLYPVLYISPLIALFIMIFVKPLRRYALLIAGSLLLAMGIVLAMPDNPDLANSGFFRYGLHAEFFSVVFGLYALQTTSKTSQ